MFVGHYGVSLAARRIAPQVPLWALLLAAQAVDVAWAVFILTGVEAVRIVPGHTAVNPLDLYRMPYTHSLPAALAWSGLAGLAAFAWARRRHAPVASRLGWLLGAVVFSHWLLDLLVHAPDLPLWGDRYKVGFGLWNHPVAATIIELALLIGAALWLRSDRQVWRQSGGRALGIFVAVLVAFHVVNLWMPPPDSVVAVGIGALSLYLLIAAIGYWLERRATRVGDRAAER
ncbi:MAG: hypothetical protein ACJ8G7_19360 [Rhizobacter sp.]